MFEHLDDTNPPSAGVATRRAVARRASALRARRRRLASVAAVVGLAGGTGVGLALTRSQPSAAPVRVVTHPTIPQPTVPRPAPTIPVTTIPVTTVPVTSTTLALPQPTLACAALLPQGPAGTAQTATARLGAVTARLSGRMGSLPYVPAQLNNAMLTVTQDSRTIYSQPVATPQGMTGPPLVIPGSVGPVAQGSPPLCLARFAGSAEPTVVLGLNLGGAHCCAVVRAIQLPGGPPVEINLGNSGAVLDGQSTGALIVTGDDAFNYTFNSYAASGVPLKVLEFQGGQWVATTRRHLDLVANDAPRWLTLFNQNPGMGLGLLAAWVGDECLLGRSGPALATVGQLNSKGKLTGPSTWPSGSAYVSALRTFLTQHGYL